MYRSLSISTLFAALLLASACEKKAEDTGGATTETAASTSVEDAARGPLEAYEMLRAGLANDDPSKVPATATSLASGARKAAASAPEAARKQFNALAEAADALAKTPTEDMDAVRKAFGEVSRHVVGLLADVPALRKGRHVFECPMAQDYGKWVQASEKLENPYMGKKMLGCGSKSDWKS